jgi:hypothetical protein
MEEADVRTVGESIREERDIRDRSGDINESDVAFFINTGYEKRRRSLGRLDVWIRERRKGKGAGRENKISHNQEAKPVPIKCVKREARGVLSKMRIRAGFDSTVFSGEKV